MFVQINTDNNTRGSEQWTEPLREKIGESLKRFSSQVTSFLVYLGDENGKKGGSNDKRCVIEARIDRIEPITVTAHSESYEQAVRAAIDKMRSTLDSRFGRLSNH